MTPLIKAKLLTICMLRVLFIIFVSFAIAYDRVTGNKMVGRFACVSCLQSVCVMEEQKMRLIQNCHHDPFFLCFAM